MCLRACLGEAFRQTEAVFSSLGLYSLDISAKADFRTKN
jgi:hypothetical protein